MLPLAEAACDCIQTAYMHCDAAVWITVQYEEAGVQVFLTKWLVNLTMTLYCKEQKTNSRACVY